MGKNDIVSTSWLITFDDVTFVKSFHHLPDKALHIWEFLGLICNCLERVELVAAGSHISSSESVFVATSCSPSLSSASGLSSSLYYYKTIQTEMASSLDPLLCDAIE